jgi:hypothetical protein
MGRYLMQVWSVKERVAELLAEHGSYRAAADATKVDHAYLSRLLKGEKAHPSDTTLRKLGLIPQPYYRRSIRRQTAPKDQP